MWFRHTFEGLSGMEHLGSVEIQEQEARATHKQPWGPLKLRLFFKNKMGKVNPWKVSPIPG